ncbi:hypothetical protein MSAS_43350 [Mycobacterium saskatchewanense]|nr:hypothetical protein MSAS_43350 [Mycobacterium saskatchewanense]
MHCAKKIDRDGAAEQLRIVLVVSTDQPHRRRYPGATDRHPQRPIVTAAVLVSRANGLFDLVRVGHIGWAVVDFAARPRALDTGSKVEYEYRCAAGHQSVDDGRADT